MKDKLKSLKLRIKKLEKIESGLKDSLKGLKESESRYRRLFETAQDGILILDGDTDRIIDVNPFLRSMLGYPRSHFIGKELWEIGFYRDKVSAKKAFEILQSKGYIRYEDLPLEKKSGKKLDVEFVSNVYFIGRKRIIQCNVRDVTNRKKVEGRLKTVYRKMKLTREEFVQNSKMAVIGQLSSGVAHEINNPLTGVLNNVQLVKMIAEQRKEFNLGDFKELLDDIEKSAVRCQKIVRSLLDISHVSRGKGEALNINMLIEQVLDVISNEMRISNVDIQQDLGRDLNSIKGDPQLLEQVIMNLVLNSKWAVKKKFEKQGGCITIKTWQKPKDKIVIFSISDNGIGISKDGLVKLFTPFFTTKMVGDGTGLGLSMAYSIIKAHHGDVTVKSDVNVGTTFKVNFPYI